MVGITQEQCSEFGWGNVLHPEDAERTIEAWKQCVKTEGMWDIEHRFLGRDGQWHPVLARGIPVRDENNNIICWAGINLDMSNLKAIQNLNQELEESNILKDRFVAMVAHELRNPANAIAIQIEILHSISDNHCENCRTCLGTVKRNFNSITHLLNDLADFSRIRSGKIPLDKEPVRLITLIENAKIPVEKMVNEKAQTLKLEVPDIEMCVDPIRIEQVLSNLMINASKYTPPNGCICVRAEEVNGEVNIAVSDTGYGIPEDMKSKIFDMFTQVKEHANYSHGGLGIGLHIVKQLVELHGGKIALQSEVNKGSTFTISIPKIGRDKFPLKLLDR